MKRAKVVVALMLGTMTLAAQVPTNTSARTSSREAILGRRLDAINLKHLTAREALGTILNGTGIPGGIVTLQEEAGQPRYSLLIPRGWTLGRVLNYLTGVVPYRWQLSGGAVNLFPEGKVPALLGLTISEFDFEDVSDRSLLEQELRERPEIRERAAQLGLEWAPLETGLGVYMPPGENAAPARSVHLRNITLVKALNAITRARGGGVWTYAEQVKQGKIYVGISF